MKQLYEVGEVVILKYNSLECIILKVNFEEAIEITGREGLHSTFCYKIGIIGPNGFDYWTESALRKKQEPGQMGYKELMTSLKNSVLEWN